LSGPVHWFILIDMKLHIVPFGDAVYEKRKDIYRAVIEAASGPPWDFRGVLHLVPNDRAARFLRLLFIETLSGMTGASGCIPPVFSPLNRFISSRAARHADAPLVDGMARELAVEEACAAVLARGGYPDFSDSASLLAPSVAAALSRLAVYDIDPVRITQLRPDSRPASLLAEDSREYGSWLRRHGIADGPAFRAGYRPESGEFGYATVILDGFYDADPVELRVMKALAEAPDTHFILAAPGLTEDALCGPGMPYSGTREMLDALGLAVEGLDEPRGGEYARVLAGALYTGRPMRETAEQAKALGRPTNITVQGCLNPDEEVHYIATTIKEGVLAGTLNPDRTLVLFPDPAAYAPIIEDVFEDYGIPYHCSWGSRLVESPVTAAVFDALSVSASGWSFRSVRKLLSSPLFSFSEGGNHAAEFSTAARKAGITGGRARWAALADGLSPGDDGYPATAPLRGLIGLIGGFDHRMRLTDWSRTLLSFIESSGMAGQLSGDRGLEAAHTALVSAIGSLAAGSERLRSTLTAAGFASVLRRSVSGIESVRSDVAASGVRLLTRMEAFSEGFDTVFAGGLSEGALPGRRARDAFIPDTVAGLLGMPDTKTLRARDGRLFLGLAAGHAGMILTYPQNSAQGTVAPSPYITALEPFYRAGLVSKGSGWTRPDDPAKAFGPKAYVRAVSLNGPAPSAARIARPPALPAGHTGRGKFSATELEEYLRCPYRYYLSRLAGGPLPEDPGDDIAPLTAGVIVHSIFNRFHKKITSVTRDTEGEALAALLSIAKSEFAGLVPTALNIELERNFTEAIAQSFIRSEILLHESGMTVHESEKSVELSLEDPELGTVTITGKIDRLETDNRGGFAVADYKAGGYPGSGKGSGRNLSDQFQLPLYAAMARAGLPSGTDTSPRPTAFVYYNLKTPDVMRDVVVYDAAGYHGPSEGLKTNRNKSVDVMDRLVEEAVQKALGAVRGIIGSEFRPSRNRKECVFCRYDELCGRPEDDEGETDDD